MKLIIDLNLKNKTPPYGLQTYRVRFIPSQSLNMGSTFNSHAHINRDGAIPLPPIKPRTSPRVKSGALPASNYLNPEVARKTIDLGTGVTLRHTDYLCLLFPQISSHDGHKFLANMGIPLVYVGADAYYNESSLNKVIYQLTKPGATGVALPNSTPVKNLLYNYGGVKHKKKPVPLYKLSSEIIRDIASPAVQAEIALSTSMETARITQLLNALTSFKKAQNTLQRLLDRRTIFSLDVDAVRHAPKPENKYTLKANSKKRGHPPRV